MTRSSFVVPLAFALAFAAACGPTKTDPPPPPPPGVFLIAAESNVVGQQVELTVNVTGCTTVAQVEIEQDGAFMRAVDYKGNNTKVVLPQSDFLPYYGPLGIAVDLTLAAKAVCDDGRTNTSQPVGVKFFPVKSVLEIPGSIALPDSFVAEGGASGTPVTFVGCARLETGLAIVRVDVNGQLIQQSPGLPFPCSVNSVITDINRATNTRWLFEPGKGAVAFISKLGAQMPIPDMSITAQIVGNYQMLSVGYDGDALAWEDEQFNNPAFHRVSVSGGADKWLTVISGIPNAQPIVDQSTGTIYTSSWVGQVGTYSGTVSTATYNYDTGIQTGRYDQLVLDYGDLNSPIVPHGSFSPGGNTIYFPYQTSGNQSHAGVMACATIHGAGQACQKKWESPLFDQVLKDVVVFSNGGQVAAISDAKTWFIETQTGTVSNLSGVPLFTSGGLSSLGAQVGLGPDFYLLNGVPGQFPTEIVATDAPGSGELYRYSLEGGGLDASTSLTMAVDDTGQAWLRIGTKQVKPLSLVEYRSARGPTVFPP